MATIKLGSLTLGNVAIGGSTIGDTRKLGKTKIFRAEAIKNHTLDKVVSDFVTRVVPNNTPSEGIGGNSDTDWLLANGVWNDNGVWDDTQTWND
jgi:hypothetical protein